MERGEPGSTASPTAATRRLPLIDLVRGLAIFAMVIWHLAFDLEQEGVLSRGLTTRSWGGVISSSLIAGTFILVNGVSLYLAHHAGIKWKTFLKRTAMIAAGALLITLVTALMMPQAYVFFGILHFITFANVVGVLCLRLPWALLLGLGLFFLTGAHYLTAASFDAPLWWWTGLSQTLPITSDHFPVFPWFGVTLLGLALAKLIAPRGGFERLAKYQTESKVEGLLCFLGRHSLIVYIVHQPLLVGALSVIFAVLR